MDLLSSLLQDAITLAEVCRFMEIITQSKTICRLPESKAEAEMRSRSGPVKEENVLVSRY
jgi:hypothetical protein